jgi:hypothetical protein
VALFSIIHGKKKMSKQIFRSKIIFPLNNFSLIKRAFASSSQRLSALSSAKTKFQTTAKAVELKELIDNAHRYLPETGRCLSLELHYRRRHIDPEEDVEEDYDDDYDDDNNNDRTVKDKRDTLEKIQDELVKVYDVEGFRMEDSGFECASINVLGEEIQALKDISLEKVEKWYATATNSGFGNVLKQETQHDTQVRSSRELDTTQFTVSQDILNDIALRWGEEFVPKSRHLITSPESLSIYGQKFIPQSVTVQPYKIVIYGPGDHFQFHKDTPEENLCGTFLISLYGGCQSSWVFEIRQHGESFIWSGRDDKNGWCAFYPDIPHCVKPLESGYRAILSFKIYAKNQKGPQEWNTNAAAKMKMESLVDGIQNLGVPVGILLSHHYGYDSKSIYGCDRLVLDALKKKGLEVDLKPVLIRFYGEGPTPNGKDSRVYHDPRAWDGSKVESWIYLITDEALEYVRQRLSGAEEKKNLNNSSEKIVFLDGKAGNGNGRWDYEMQWEIEYIGNEFQPHSENSVYVRYAAIVRPTAISSQTD